MFKLAPFTQEASICLRCQYHLSVREASHRVTPHRSTTTRQDIRHFAPGRRLGQDQQILVDDRSPEEGLIVPVRRYDPFSARETHRAKKDTLTFDALGKPAEVLLLYDGTSARRSRSDHFEIHSEQPNKYPESKALSSSDMLEEIGAERGLVDSDQVFENIESVKDSWTARSSNNAGLLSIAEYGELTSQLASGFTTSQLAVYFDKKVVDKPTDQLNLEYEFSSVLYSRSAWNPGTSYIQQSKAPSLRKLRKDNETSDNIIHARLDRQLSVKTMLVQKITQQCWGFAVKKDMSAEGELDLRLQEIHLDLITNHKRGILKQMSETFGAKVEASRQDRIIRITSDQDTCLDVLKVFIFTLEKIRTSMIQLPMLERHTRTSSRAEKGDMLLKQVEQLTNTVIRTRYTRKGNCKLHVHWLGPDDGDLQDVQRLVSHNARLETKNKAHFLWCGDFDKSETIPVPVDVGSRLPLIRRTQQWSRWRTPTRRKIREMNPERNTSTLMSPLDNHANAANTLNEFLAPPRVNKELLHKAYPFWQSSVVHSHSAIVGQVVFPTMAAVQESASMKTSPEGVNNHRISRTLEKVPREFVSSVAGIFRLLQPLASINSNPTNVEYLQVHLTPSLKKKNLPVPAELLPDLEIRISLDNATRSTTIEYARLVRDHKLDCLMPKHTADLRIVRSSCVYSQSAGACDPRIQQFIQDSNLDIWGTDRLRTPTELAFEIPYHALRPHNMSSKEKKPDSMLVGYTCTGLEHHSQLLIPIGKPGEWSYLQYTSIEAGKLGGRRDELALTNLGEPWTTLTNNEAHISEPNTPSLIAKLNALINALEDHSYDADTLTKAFTYGVEREDTKQLDKPKSPEDIWPKARYRLTSSVAKNAKLDDRSMERRSTSR